MKITILKKFLFVFAFSISLNYSNVFGQGCVAIRSTGGLCTMDEHPDSTVKQGAWLFNSNTRYYKSFRHFVGKQEQYQRIALGNNVINKVVTQDFTFTRLFNDRWALAVDINGADNSRSQLNTTPGTRFSTHTFGLGDTRVTGYYWLLNPAKIHNFNIQLGLGIKFATGADDLQDYFLQKDGTTRTLGPVDQSIQLGDGGTGIALEVNTYYNPTNNFGFYGNFFYLANPRDVNNTFRSISSATNATAIATTGNIESVPDQYLVRIGGSYMIKRFDFSLGLRDDCLPVRDLFGSSDGFRRPGYILSAEPGITWRVSKVAIYLYVPIAIIRDRTQSVPDIRQTELTGVYTHGDAAFADYVVNVGLTYKF